MCDRDSKKEKQSFVRSFVIFFHVVQSQKVIMARPLVEMNQNH